MGQRDGDSWRGWCWGRCSAGGSAVFRDAPPEPLVDLVTRQLSFTLPPGGDERETLRRAESSVWL